MYKIILKAALPLLFLSGCVVNDPTVPNQNEQTDDEIIIREPDFNNGETFGTNSVIEEDLISTNEIEEELNKELEEIEQSEDNIKLEDIEVVKLESIKIKENSYDAEKLFVTILFDYNQYNTKNQEELTKIKNLINFLKNNEDKLSHKKIVIEGNADQRGTDEYNYALGIKRAHYIKEQIIFNTSILNNNIKIISYGETNTICSEETPECYEKNRRVEVTFK